MSLKKQWQKLALEFGQIAAAIFLASIGLKAFLLPNGFLDGGVTGIAILISELSQIELSWVLPIATVPFFILGWFTVSKRIIVKSIISVIVLSVVIHFENFSQITDDKLITAIFGGIFLGAGIGLAIKNGSVLDGSEILGIYISTNFGISIGTVVLFFNIILFGFTAILISIDVALYSILTFIVTAKVIDFMMEGFENYVGLMIVSKKSDLIQRSLIRTIGQGMTVYNGKKGYGSQGRTDDIQIIHTVINRIDTRKAYRTIDLIDDNAFVIEFDVNHVKGGVLRSYLNSSKKKSLPSGLYQKTE
ncbi:MAG: YitT family protein [Crocinitomicaceae bacterium]